MKKEKEQSFFHIVIGIILNKNDTNGKMLPNTFALIATLIFNMLAFFLALFGIVAFFGIQQLFPTLKWDSVPLIIINILLILGAVILAVIILLLALMLRGAANEIDKEKNKHYILEVFSSIVSLSALIVALVALVRSW